MPMVGNGVWGLSWFSGLGSFLGVANCGVGGGGAMPPTAYCVLEMAGLPQ